MSIVSDYLNVHMLCVLTQDIRRFFAPTSVKPAVQKPAPNGNLKAEDKKKKKTSQSSDEEVKKKETTKARNNVMMLMLFTNMLCLDSVPVNLDQN